MSAALTRLAENLDLPPAEAGKAILAYRAEVLREAAETVRSMAPKYLDDETDQHVFWVLDGVATKLEGQS